MEKKRILITGKGSYVGTSLMKWLDQWPSQYNIEFLSLKGEEWRGVDLTKYEVIFHVAALVHKREKKTSEDQYYKVNRDLTIELATKAKKSGVGHFIFMSSFSVYGFNGGIKSEVVLNKNTICNPNSYYGKSKFEAEKGLTEIISENFKIAIIRAPMVYGPNSPGNYERLRRLSLKIKFFPLIKNQRSMIFIDYLSEFIRLVIDNQAYGTFFPQNKEYINTNNLIKLISSENNKKVIFSKFLGFVFSKFGVKIGVIKKVYGNLVFDLDDSSHFDHKYCFSDLKESIRFSELNLKNQAIK
ncbi:NAD-dependent epimerase/dehydratase family protein [Paenibacillus silagei]|uniref:UDP-glucose 4-epimerase n=1 Tax=Paenibacillus silagei TaxID=1670801 RepID=A0ABS4NWE8_9BACL|nr:NAD-dependent epimerase/dehydratase family protein [Paenibacillus silagei]MBP2114398.1 UDP-glucose 4-epimerase [Paenibacillus silagei]